MLEYVPTTNTARNGMVASSIPYLNETWRDTQMAMQRVVQARAER